MTQGAGLVGLLYELKYMIDGTIMFLLSSAGVIIFFMLVVSYIAKKANLTIPFLPQGNPKRLMWSLFVLFIIFSIYSLIGLTAAVFGVNSSPSGGILVQ